MSELKENVNRSRRVSEHTHACLNIICFSINLCLNIKYSARPSLAESPQFLYVAEQIGCQKQLPRQQLLPLDISRILVPQSSRNILSFICERFVTTDKS